MTQIQQIGTDKGKKEIEDLVCTPKAVARKPEPIESFCR